MPQQRTECFKISHERNPTATTDRAIIVELDFKSNKSSDERKLTVRTDRRILINYIDVKLPRM